MFRAAYFAIAKGELKPKAGDPKVWFTSPESFAKLLSNRNRALLAHIADTHPESVHELARLADQAQAAPDEGTEALQTEIEDLIEGISRRVRLDRERG